MFTIDAQNLIQSDDDQFWSNSESGGITAFSDEDLNALLTSGDQRYYTIGTTGTDGNTLLEEASHRSDETDTDWDYSLELPGQSGYHQAYRTMLKINRTGYYNFRIIVTFKRSVDDEYEGNIVNHVSSIKLAVAPVVSSYFIKIFASNLFDTHGAQGSTGGSGPFITHDFAGTNDMGNELLYIYDFQELGGTLSLDDEVFVPADGQDPVSLNDIAQSADRSICDHVTGKEIVGSLDLDKNYVLYLE